MSRLKATLVVSTCLFTGLVLVLLFHHRARLHLPIKGTTDSRVGQQLSLNYQMSTLQLTSTPSDINTTTIYHPSITTADASTTGPSITTTNASTPYTATTLLTPKTADVAIHSVADLYERLICVTAFSDNHFNEAKDMIADLQTCLPDKKIIVYDLGLNSGHRKEVSSYCNVELRSFPFKDYQQSHVKNLYTFAWKPIIAKLMSVEHDVIMYGDSSLRMISCNISSALAYLFEFPFLDLNPTSHPAIEFTHDGMIKYLHYPKSRKDMAHIETLQGGCWLMWANTVMKEKLIEPWLDCALHKECIAPKGANRSPCHTTQNHDGHYIDCHRFDQSALNLILAREFGLDGVLKGSNRKITHPVWDIARKPIHTNNISLCT